MRAFNCSENPVTGSSRVHFSKSGLGNDVQSSLGLKASVLIEPVGSHAGFESDELTTAHLLKDGLARRALIFTGESIWVRVKINQRLRVYLPSDGIVNKSRLF